MKKNVVLTGMMGVGKSTVGKNLAERLNYKFVDIDRLIEKIEGCSIKIIFKQKSEIYFRKLEKQVTLRELEKENIVLALGGGAFLDKSVRQEIQKINKFLVRHQFGYFNQKIKKLIKDHCYIKKI